MIDEIFPIFLFLFYLLYSLKALCINYSIRDMDISDIIFIFHLCSTLYFPLFPPQSLRKQPAHASLAISPWQCSRFISYLLRSDPFVNDGLTDGRGIILPEEEEEINELA